MTDDFERVAYQRLERELALEKAQAARRAREHAASTMSADQWSRVYGAPVPGQSRPLREVTEQAQLAAHGRAWGSGDAGPGWR